jgi:hypothetical protein
MQISSLIIIRVPADFIAYVRFMAIGKFIRSSKLILAMSVGIYETAKAALEKDDRQYLNNKDM